MRDTLVRASFIPIICEMIDFNLGIYSRDAELIAEGIPWHSTFHGHAHIHDPTRWSSTSAVENIEEGDVLLSTYPYWVGSHSQDAAVIRPIFVEGKIFGYTAVKAHWMDLGAKDIYGTDTTDIWREGLQLFGVKVMKARQARTARSSISFAPTRACRRASLAISPPRSPVVTTALSASASS